MLHFIRKLAAAALLMMIPLQGLAAASLSVMQCPLAAAGAAQSSNSDDGAGQERDGDGVKTFFEHFFCHQLSSAIPVVPPVAATPHLPVFEPSLSLPASLFFPEQPQRPPFAVSV
ncbi:MAG: hypothetical protein A3G25_08440 [Betaproteobacteria bacterium RIFCSPLOWO2_12_FULL_63_13]|nr:MAG: hypothetical protein A3G25_08440 [Betaproteobacteria bacterium RIFCSPLOWO2_12_FULL_63_13]